MIPGVPYDAEIEYLESTGTQLIKTGIFGNNDNLAFDLKFRSLAFRSYAGIFGNYVSENHNCWRLLPSNTDNGTNYVCTNTKAAASYAANMPKNIDYVFNLDKTNYSVNGQTYSSPTVKGSGNNYEIVIFAQRQDATDPYKAIMRLYYFKIYNNGTLVRDFIPVRVGQTGYMYDRVTRRLFGNKGTGSFVLGPDVAKPVMGLWGMRKRRLEPSDYVQDGLVAMWDGEWNAGEGVHDATLTKWPDLIRGVEFTLNSASQIQWRDTGLVSTSAIAGAYATIATNVPDALCMQIVLKGIAGASSYINNQPIFINLPSASGGRYAVQFRNDYILAGAGGGQTKYYPLSRADQNSAISNGLSITLVYATVKPISPDVFYLGTTAQTSGGTAWGGTQSVLSIGGTSSWIALQNTVICALRLYSSALSPTEIAHNYQIDKARFNLP